MQILDAAKRSIAEADSTLNIATILKPFLPAFCVKYNHLFLNFT
jgi:hypothetical protein